MGGAGDKSQVITLQPIVTARALDTATLLPKGCKGAASGVLAELNAKITQTSTLTTYYFDVIFDTGANYDSMLGSGLTTGDTFPGSPTLPSGATFTLN